MAGVVAGGGCPQGAEAELLRPLSLRHGADMAALPVVVRVMADATLGTVSRRDLVAMGFSASTVDGWEDLGLLERCYRGEFRIAGSGDPLVQRLALMLWRAGDGARLAGALACGLRGLDGFSECDSTYIAVPSRRRVRGVDYRVVRTPVPPEDQDLIRGLPGVTVERGLIGAAATHREARVRRAFYSARFLGLTNEEKLAERAGALGRVHGAPQMRRILGTGSLAVESPKEWDLATIFRGGDPQPETRVWVCWHDRWHRLDFAFLPGRLALEYDGRQHEATRQADADRDLALMELDIQTIRVTKQMLRDPVDLRRRVLAVYAKRVALDLPPLVPALPPWL